MKTVLRDPETLTLANGLRLVHMRQSGAETATFGVAVLVGSGDETEPQQGLAHFVEHTVFKGTARRNSWHIINRMEAVGGELNAYTTKDATVVYTSAPRGNAARAIELVADLVINSRFPEAELEKERQVVLDEIDSYLDMPSEAVFDDFEDALFAGTPLGHNILGNRKTVTGFGSSECREFLRAYYRAGNMVAFYSGPQGADTIARLVERHFADLPEGSPVRENRTLVPVRTFRVFRKLPIHQSHIIAGVSTGGMDAPERYALTLLANITGGPGMNSLLNVSLRERRGLVYSVESMLTLFARTGELTVYFGCDNHDVDECLALTADVFRTLAEKPIGERALAMAKKQFLGQRILASQNRESRILGAARSTLILGAPVPEKEIVERFQSVTASEIAAAAQLMIEPSVLGFVSRR